MAIWCPDLGKNWCASDCNSDFFEKKRLATFTHGNFISLLDTTREMLDFGMPPVILMKWFYVGP
jgi:hypothetical protein